MTGFLIGVIVVLIAEEDGITVTGVSGEVMPYPLEFECKENGMMPFVSDAIAFDICIPAKRKINSQQRG